MSVVTCQSCGQPHPLEEVEGSFLLPDTVSTLGRFARLLRSKSERNFCVLDKSQYFVRCLLPIPVHDEDDSYCWGIWAELSSESFKRIKRTWNAPTKEQEPPFVGVLANNIPLYTASTAGLPVEIKHSAPGTAPMARITDFSHPLGNEQRKGVSLGRAMEFNHFVLHGAT